MMYLRISVILRMSFLATFLGATGLGALPLPNHNVTLAWNPSPSAIVAGYRLYQGAASQDYTSTIEVGDLTSVTVSNLTSGATYFFAVTAYDIIGLESVFSSEIAYTVPGSASLLIDLSTPGEVLLMGTAPSGYQYDIQRTGDLSSWVPVGGITVGTAGVFQFTDALAAGSAAQYYRLRQTFP